ncbi:thioredoxin [uncultured Croceitalea sp.]|uniref:thioredoxin n=1 Tax=uncultured Croceitalea sp. TaxID=1798908 RepID=UPI00374F4D80
MIQQLDKSNFQETINNNDVVLVDFYADWCGPCNALRPTLEVLDKEFEGKAIISKINVDKNPELSSQFDVRSIPALFYFKNGKVVGKQNGVQPKDVLSQNLNNLLTA